MHCGNQRHAGLCLGRRPCTSRRRVQGRSQGTTLSASDSHNARATILNPFNNAWMGYEYSLQNMNRPRAIRKHNPHPLETMGRVWWLYYHTRPIVSRGCGSCLWIALGRFKFCRFKFVVDRYLRLMGDKTIPDSAEPRLDSFYSPWVAGIDLPHQGVVDSIARTHGCVQNDSETHLRRLGDYKNARFMCGNEYSERPNTYFKRVIVVDLRLMEDYKTPPHLVLLDRYLWRMGDKTIPEEAPPSLESFYPPWVAGINLPQLRCCGFFV